MPYLELEVSSGDDAPTCEVSGEAIVGSGSQATWRLPNRDLAARHFRVRISGDGSRTLAPCSSQNIVVLNGRAASPSGEQLTSGDVIAAGSARFIYLEQLSDPRPAHAPPAEPGYLLDGAEGIAYPLRSRVLQIGREISCSIVLRDPTVSRFHADVRAEGGEYVLYSMGVTGTFLNGQPLRAPRMLEPRDQIRIGSSTLSFIRGALPTGVREGMFDARDGGSIHRRPTITPRAVGVRAAIGDPRLLFAIAVMAVAALVLVVLL